MFKLVVIAAVLALASARPGFLHDAHHLVKTTIVKSAPIFHTQHVLQKAIISEPTQIAVQEPYLAKIGERVETIPTSYSHVYRSDIHSKTLVKDIIAPVVKSYIKPVVKHIEIQPVVAHAEAAVIVEEPKIVKKIEKEIHIGHVSSAAEAIVSAPVVHAESGASLSVASADAVVETPAEVYGVPKVSAESFATVEVKAPVVHAKAHAIIETPAVPFTSYEAPLGPVHADAKASAISIAHADTKVSAINIAHAEAKASAITIAHVPSREYGVPSSSSSVKAEAFASVNAPYPAAI